MVLRKGILKIELYWQSSNMKLATTAFPLVTRPFSQA